MFARHVGCTFGLRDALAHAGNGETSFNAIEFTVNAFLHALVNSGLHFVGSLFGFLQSRQSLFPFSEIGVTQRSILDDLIALVFGIQSGDGGVDLGGPHKIAQSGVKQSRLGIQIKQRRRRPLQRQGKAIRIAQTSAGGELRDVVVAQFLIGSRGVLCVSRSNSGPRRVGQGKLNHAFERHPFGQQRSLKQKKCKNPLRGITSVPRVFHCDLFTATLF